jgi:phosphate transport system permease protein
VLRTSPTNGARGGATRAADRLFRWLTAGVAVVVVGLLAAVAIQLVLGSAPAFNHFGASFVTGQTWDPSKVIFGALPFIAGTLITSLLAMLLAVPIGILTAVFLSEMAPRWLAIPLTFTVDLIAAIPSVIVGLWGLGVLSVFLRDVFEIPITDGFGGLPFVGADATGSDLLAATLVLALMVTPTIVAITREVFATVPQSNREAMLGLGGTRWETIRRVVLPAARSGIVGASILALGRAMGETMAVTMTIGNADRVPTGLFEPAQTIASKIATSWNEASQAAEQQALIGLGLVLMVLSVAMVFATRVLLRGRPTLRRAAAA